MPELTTDQLDYVLTRKYIGIEMGKDVSIIGSLTNLPNGDYEDNLDAHIITWNLNHIQKPTDEEIMKWWKILQPQYDADPTRYGSAISRYMRAKAVANKPPIVINENI